MPPPSDSQRTTLRSKVLLGFGIVLVMLVLIAAISVQSTRGFNRTSQWVAVTYEAIEVQGRMLRNVTEREAGRRAFMRSGAEAQRKAFAPRKAGLEQGMNALRSLTAASPGEAA